MLPPSGISCASITFFCMWPEALCSCVYALDYLDMPTMSLNHTILSLFWSPRSLLGQCQLSHSQQRAAVRDEGKARSYTAKGARGGTKTLPGWSPEPSTCPRHMPPQCVNAHISSALWGRCSMPAHPDGAWTSLQAALPAGMPSYLTTGTKCLPSNTLALGCHGRDCQLDIHCLWQGGMLSLNHPGHPVQWTWHPVPHIYSCCSHRFQTISYSSCPVLDQIYWA